MTFFQCVLLSTTLTCFYGFRRSTIIGPRQTSSNLKLVTDSSLMSLAAGAIAGIMASEAYPILILTLT